MSSTTTVEAVLEDYKLHHSGSSGNEPILDEAQNQSARQAPIPPIEWDTTHRRVPPYRPINRNRDPLETRVYTSRIEQVFLGTMFTGVFLNAMTAQIWRQTFGRLNDRIFRYQLGGEI